MSLYDLIKYPSSLKNRWHFRAGAQVFTNKKAIKFEIVFKTFFLIFQGFFLSKFIETIFPFKCDLILPRLHLFQLIRKTRNTTKMFWDQNGCKWKLIEFNFISLNPMLPCDEQKASADKYETRGMI